MQKPEPKTDTESEVPAVSELPAYEPPVVATYTDAQLLAALGPAQAGGTYSLFTSP